MNYLITGSRGFIGSNLVAKLKSLGHTVFEYNRDGCIPPILPMEQVDSIIHCAASVKDESHMIHSNIILTNDILSVALSHPNIKSIVLIGSSSEYGVTNETLTEDLPLNPYNLYEATKGAASFLGLAYARQYGLPVCIARPMSVYGQNDKDYHFIPRLVKSAYTGESITIHPGVHDWVHVNDFIDGLITLSQSDPNKIRGDQVIFGTGIQRYNEYIVEHVQQITGRTINAEYKNEKMYSYDQRKNWVCSPAKALEKYGWAAKIGFIDGLKDYVNSVKDTYLQPYDIGAL